MSHALRSLAASVAFEISQSFEIHKTARPYSRPDTSLMAALRVVADIEDMPLSLVHQRALALFLCDRFGLYAEARKVRKVRNEAGGRGAHVGMSALTAHLESCFSDLTEAVAERDQENAAAEEARRAKRAESAMHTGFPKIPVARRHRLFDPKALPAVRAESVGGRDVSDHDESWLQRLRASSSVRSIPVVDERMRARVRALRECAPNLSTVLDAVERDLTLAERTDGLLSLQPILMVGPPAAGKTWLASMLASALDPAVPVEIISMPGCTAAFEISGSSRSWSRARPGRILRTFISHRTASPVFVLDEIDKPPPGNYPPAPALLPLVERSDATRFRDEFMDMTFDMSLAVIVATANTLRGIDDALLSRFRVLNAGAPNATQRPAIIRSLYNELRASFAKLDLPDALDEDVVRALSYRFQDARQMQRLLRDCLGEAAIRPGPALSLDVFAVGRACGLGRPAS